MFITATIATAAATIVTACDGGDLAAAIADTPLWEAILAGEVNCTCDPDRTEVVLASTSRMFLQEVSEYLSDYLLEEVEEALDLLQEDLFQEVEEALLEAQEELAQERRDIAAAWADAKGF